MTQPDAATTDGRRQRSARSRAQIVEAVLALVREGDMAPGAARVAERAGVGLRTVFRHFEDMESLYGEIIARIQTEILPLMQKPFTAKDWRGRIAEMIERRIDIYERILPLRVAGAVRRFHSTSLMAAYRTVLAAERLALEGVLPAQVRGDVTLVAALDLATGFESWRRLRQDMGLAPPAAAAVVRTLVARLLPKA